MRNCALVYTGAWFLEVGAPRERPKIEPKSIKIGKLRAREPRRGPRDPRNRPREAQKAENNEKEAIKGEGGR